MQKKNKKILPYYYISLLFITTCWCPYNLLSSIEKNMSFRRSKSPRRKEIVKTLLNSIRTKEIEKGSASRLLELGNPMSLSFWPLCLPHPPKLWEHACFHCVSHTYCFLGHKLVRIWLLYDRLPCFLGHILNCLFVGDC